MGPLQFTAGRAGLVAFALALAGCAPSPPARAPIEARILPASGPLRPETAARLLLTDATRAGQRIVAVGDHGYILTSDDDGASWKRAAAPDSPLLTGVYFLDAKNGWAVGHDAVVLATGDGGDTWTRQFSAPSEDRPLMGILFLDREHGIAVGAYGDYVETSDGGRTWKERKIESGDRHLNAILPIGDAQAPEGRRLLIVGEEGTILLSKDGGAGWTKVPSPYKGSLFGGVTAADGSVVIFGLRGRIFRSTDGGETWTPVEDTSSATLMGGSRLPDGVLVVAGNAGTLLASRDDGRTFAAVATGTVHPFGKAIPGAPGRALVVGEAGLRQVTLPPERAEAK
ncbi:MAG TPA: YCF48-related protein [Usitatibacter sp.]|nr:YCF48-related protein [Usitatibacter sp.]